MNDCLIVIASIVSAVATVALALLAYSNLVLARSIRATTDQRDQEIKDLFQAMVIAQLLGPHPNDPPSTAKQRFKKEYTGKTKIFE